MTLTIATLPPMAVGQSVLVGVTVTGASPVHSVILDFPADGQPAWYYELFDGRGAMSYTVGPLKKKGRLEFTARAVDEMGCEVANGTRTWVTVQ